MWVLWGYSIAFSDVEMEKGRYNLHSFFGSLGNIGLTGISLFSSTGNYPASIFVTFHCMFACITTALITGAFAERMKLTAAWAFAVLWSMAVYCPLAHQVRKFIPPRPVALTNPNPKPDTQVWGGDGAFLHSLGAIDFAGGIVVHVSSGVSGLTVASMIGKRTGYPLIPKAPHSLVLTHVGASLLWVGWFGFNAGSSTAADFIAGQAMLVTQIASAAELSGDRRRGIVLRPPFQPRRSRRHRRPRRRDLSLGFHRRDGAICVVSPPSRLLNFCTTPRKRSVPTTIPSTSLVSSFDLAF